MGVTENRRSVYFVSSQRELRDHSSDEDSNNEAWVILDNQPTEQPPESHATVERRRQPRAPPSPATPRRGIRVGHKLSLKKGRRSRHRYNEERSLFAQSGGGVDNEFEDAPDGWDIPNGTRSHFTSLLNEENKVLLDDFVNDCEDVIQELILRSDKHIRQQQQRKRNKLRCSSVCDDFEIIETEDEEEEHDDKDPDEAFMAISSYLRGAIKKHVPLGMLDGVETEIRDFFIAKPNDQFVATTFSSYERLLAHAASCYNHLHSRSVNENGTRMLKIENPNRCFKAMDPSLTEYLKAKHPETQTN